MKNRVELGGREMTLGRILAALLLPGGLLLGLAATPSAQAQTYTVLYSFKCFSVDGQNPLGGLLLDAAGNLYGTTFAGGNYHVGTAFEIPAGGEETVLYSFGRTPTDGISPRGAMVMNADGNLYGTAYQGGSYDYGTVFRLTPDGREATLHSFAGYPVDGVAPVGGLTSDATGNLYGTTSEGGAYGYGTVFRLPETGREAVLHNFDYTDGTLSSSNLVRDGAGNLYGTTSSGGAYGYGTVFELDTAGKNTVLQNFAGYPADGAYPLAGLVRDTAGNLYGTTEYGGASDGGVVFKLDATGTETVLYSFTGGRDGGHPSAGLVEDQDGNLYGATVNGGSARCGSIGCGVVFKLSAAGHESVLHNFAGPPADGETPLSGLVRDSGGNLYGTTQYGGIGEGSTGCGTVFKIAPKASGEE